MTYSEDLRRAVFNEIQKRGRMAIHNIFERLSICQSTIYGWVDQAEKDCSVRLGLHEAIYNYNPLFIDGMSTRLI